MHWYYIIYEILRFVAKAFKRFGINVIWHFYAAVHGKGPSDQEGTKMFYKMVASLLTSIFTWSFTVSILSSWSGGMLKPIMDMIFWRVQFYDAVTVSFSVYNIISLLGVGIFIPRWCFKNKLKNVWNLGMDLFQGCK